MDQNKVCPKCEKNMSRGRLYIITSHKEEPNKMFGYVNWEATDEKKFGGLYAYRCEGCGFLEYYAEKSK